MQRERCLHCCWLKPSSPVRLLVLRNGQKPRTVNALQPTSNIHLKPAQDAPFHGPVSLLPSPTLPPSRLAKRRVMVNGLGTFQAYSNNNLPLNEFTKLLRSLRSVRQSSEGSAPRTSPSSLIRYSKARASSALKGFRIRLIIGDSAIFSRMTVTCTCTQANLLHICLDHSTEEKCSSHNFTFEASVGYSLGSRSAPLAQPAKSCPNLLW